MCSCVLLSFSPPPSHLQPAAELEVQAEEISGQKTEDGGQTAWRGDQVNSLQHIHKKPLKYSYVVARLCDSRLKKNVFALFFSLSSDEEEGNSDEEPDKKTQKEEEGGEDDDEEEMERKLAELKAEEVSELKRYVRITVFFLLWIVFYL